MKILFFGSTADSVIVLEKLSSLPSVAIAAVVTQPAKPIGRTQIMTPTPVEVWAKQYAITSLTFESNPEKSWLFTNEQQVIDALQPIGADLLVSASYGIKIPWNTIQSATFGGINVHPSLLPHWRGADPVPWAILSGNHQIGVTVVTLSETFDQGIILAQKKIPITPKDTSDPLRTKLFTIGANLLVDVLPLVSSDKLPHHSRNRGNFDSGNVSKLPYARKFTREDGFEPWETINLGLTEGTDAERLERKFRALHPWPGIWTKIIHNGEELRLKILDLYLDNGKIAVSQVQLEGKMPVSWKQFASAYLPS